MNGTLKRWALGVLLLFSLQIISPFSVATANGALRLSQTEIALGIGETGTLCAALLPSAAPQAVYYRSEHPEIATVSKDGAIRARKAGITRVTVYSASDASVYKTARVVVSARPAPSRVSLTPKTATLNLDETLKLSASVRPSGANQAVVYRVSDPAIARVSESGVVTPLREGTVRVRAYARARKKVYATARLTIVDPLSPSAVILEQDDAFLAVGSETRFTCVVRPEGADAKVLWSSADESVATVDETGLVRAKSPGRAKITVTTERGGKTDEALVTVLNDERVTEIPLRTTPVSAAAIRQNLVRIDDIRGSANDELNSLLARNVIGRSDYERRKAILINAFSMQRFPFITRARVPYWTSAYKGKKDFYPGKVYYGLPYIQTGTDNQYTNRRFNVALALSYGYYAKTGSGYYYMTSRRMAERYVGNDCSSFLSAATWMGIYPMTNAICYLTTRDMAVSPKYNTIRGFDNLRPGDALVKSGSHTVMFLYYTDAAKTRMMIVEQGGGSNSDMHNTVCCSVVSRSAYSGYTIRRASNLSER